MLVYTWNINNWLLFKVISYFPNRKSTIWGIYSEYLLFFGNSLSKSKINHKDLSMHGPVTLISGLLTCSVARVRHICHHTCFRTCFLGNVRRLEHGTQKSCHFQQESNCSLF